MSLEHLGTMGAGLRGRMSSSGPNVAFAAEFRLRGRISNNIQEISGAQQRLPWVLSAEDFLLGAEFRLNFVLSVPQTEFCLQGGTSSSGRGTKPGPSFPGQCRCICMCICIYIYICMYVCMYVCIMYVCMYVYIHKYKITIHSHRPRYVGQLTFQRTLGRALLATSTSVLECQAQTSSVGSPSTTSIDHLGQTRHFFDRGRTHVATCQRHWAAMVTLSRSVTVVVAWSKLL